MLFKNIFLIFFVSCTLFFSCSIVFAQTDYPQYYFYQNLPYGTQASFNPVTVIFNRGFDVIQCQLDRKIFQKNYSSPAKNVFNNLLHPIEPIKEYGVKEFFTREILPLNFTQKHSRWIPNYSLHLLGGGMTYTALAEWFIIHKIPAPRVFSATTIILTALINETIENKGTGRNTDAIADFWFFDLGGILLFSSPKVNRFFSHYLNLADWSLQPSFNIFNGELHNNGQYFSLKIKLPYSQKLSFFTYAGMATLAGISYKFADNVNLSIGGGVKISRLVKLNEDFRQNKIELGNSLGLFIDKNNSLLASLVWGDVEDYYLSLNIYPALIKISNFSPGLWVVSSRQGQLACGITARFSMHTGICL